MNRPLFHKSRRDRSRLRRQAGITMVLVAVAMVAIIAMAALSIDVVTLYLARVEAQRSADAAALAAARVISVSGMTGDPNNSSGTWGLICGGSSTPATQAAIAAAKQDLVGGVAPTVDVRYYTIGEAPTPDCSGLPAAFGVNPLVTVQVTRTGLPTFFSRIWGNSGNTVKATAAAEAFNSSNSGNVSNGPTGTITPVQPRCVKPWIVWNLDPLKPNDTCQDSSSCSALVNQNDGHIVDPGVTLNGSTTSTGVVGETFYLTPNCFHTGGSCNPRSTSKFANYNNGYGYMEGPPNLLYLPAEAPSTTPVGVPSCASGGSMYEQAIAGCDQSTVYQCGVQNGTTVDMSVNPGGGTNDTTNAVACLIDEGDPTDHQPDGQDNLNPYAEPSAYPFQILAGSSNALVGNGLTAGTPITSSNSIVSLPIIDNTTTVPNNGTKQVTVVGFLQVFINSADPYGNVYVTVLNVTGCSAGGGQPVGTAVTGSSPVPVRLITPP
jgi:putative Flp pilus-assembly TadE/G-like protein